MDRTKYEAITTWTIHVSRFPSQTLAQTLTTDVEDARRAGAQSVSENESDGMKLGTSATKWYEERKMEQVKKRTEEIQRETLSIAGFVARDAAAVTKDLKDLRVGGQVLVGWNAGGQPLACDWEDEERVGPDAGIGLGAKWLCSRDGRAM